MQKKKSTTSGTLPRDRFTYLWLALAVVLMFFGTTRWTIPLAVWLYPVFLLRFVRTQPVWRGIGLSLLASVLVLEFTGQGVFPIPVPFYYLIAFGMGTAATLPYLIDRLLAPRLGGMLGILVFPLAVTTLWYLLALVVPFGTFGNPAYTQYGNLPLLQLLAVTGIWGINLLMGWFASVVNWAWERGFAWPRVRGGVQPLLVVDNSSFSPTRLTILPGPAYPSFQSSPCSEFQAVRIV
jgi:apolipoprotein N-acyltransferase